jgi:hypothetical protein
MGLMTCLAVLFAVSGHTGLAQQKGTDPEVRVTKYDDLAQEVLKHRGKVVLVDLWFTT